MKRATYGDNFGRVVTVLDADPQRDGKPSVRIEWAYKRCVYTPLDGDEETAAMIRLCAENQVPLEILADRIDDVEPPEPAGEFPDFTKVMRRAATLMSLRIFNDARPEGGAS